MAEIVIGEKPADEKLAARETADVCRKDHGAKLPITAEPGKESP